MRLHVFFSATSAPLATDEKGLFQGRHRSFRVIYAVLEQGTEISEPSFSFLILLIVIRNNHKFPLYPLVWQKCLKVLYAWSPRSSPLISIWLRVSSGEILCISIATSHHGLSGCSLLLETVISAFKYNQIKESNPENPHPFRKLIPKSLLFRTSPVTKGCTSQGFPEKQNQ